MISICLSNDVNIFKQLFFCLAINLISDYLGNKSHCIEKIFQSHNNYYLHCVKATRIEKKKDFFLYLRSRRNFKHTKREKNRHQNSLIRNVGNRTDRAHKPIRSTQHQLSF